MPKAPKRRPAERLFGDSQPVTEDEADGYFIEPQERPVIDKGKAPVLSDDETADADDEQEIEGMNLNDDAEPTSVEASRKRKPTEKVSDAHRHSLLSLLHHADPRLFSLILPLQLPRRSPRPTAPNLLLLPIVRRSRLR